MTGGKLVAKQSKEASVTIRYLMPPDYIEDDSGNYLPGCVGELQCDSIYVESGGVGCRVRYACERLAWDQYGPGGRCIKPFRREKVSEGTNK